MSIFEFLSTAASIVLALSVGKLLTGIQDVFNRERRDILFSLVYLLTLLSNLALWWNLYSLNTVTTWNFWLFAYFILSPLIYYVIATVLLTQSPNTIVSWKNHFEANYRVIFSLLLVAGFVGAIRPFVLGGEIELFRLFFVFPLLMVVVTSNRQIHIAIVSFLLIAVVLTLTFVLPPHT